ncbi:MAG: patatin-like phospholipase family protein, partial [Pseudomonadota bacterium]
MATDTKSNDVPAKSKERIALVLGGGAPTLTLMAGALLALDEKGVEFDVISTSGAGMLVGLLYAAAKGGDRRAALRQTVHLGVHDDIYRHFPINYKVFYKPGPLAQLYYQTMMPWVQQLPHETSEQRLYKDLVHLWVTTWSPSDMTANSLGMCAAAPWLEEVVDFDHLKKNFEPEFFINAWNIGARKMEIFDKDSIGADQFRAALAFPLIYPPFEMNGAHFIEGSAMDTLNLEGLLRYDEFYDRAYPRLFKAELAEDWAMTSRLNEHRTAANVAQIAQRVGLAKTVAQARVLEARDAYGADFDEWSRENDTPDDDRDAEFKRVPEIASVLEEQARLRKHINTIDKIIVFDALGTEQLVRRPRNLYDAWVMQMIVPLVSISNQNIELFEQRYDKPQTKKLLHRLKFAEQIGHDEWINVLDWSYSNLNSLFHAGRRAGDAFFDAHEWLQDHVGVLARCGADV